MPGSRHFPPPWSVAEYNDACFIVRDHNGQALAFVDCFLAPTKRGGHKGRPQSYRLGPQETRKGHNGTVWYRIDI